MFHATNMPELDFKWIGMKELDQNVWEITVEIENTKIIPTRLGLAASKQIGLPDLLTLDGPKVVLAGTISDRSDRTIDTVDARPNRLLIERGIPGNDFSTFRFIVSGTEGEKVTLQYKAEKARDIEIEFELKETEIESGDE